MTISARIDQRRCRQDHQANKSKSFHLPNVLSPRAEFERLTSAGF